ncbi:MAG: hypothetical protein WC849_00885 [Candidatus Paceibacterota bacterium]
MAKRILDDIISTGKNSIRRVSLNREESRNKADVEIPSPPKIRREKRASSFGLWFVALIIIVFLFFLFSIFFSGAKVLVYPQKASVQLDENFVLTKDIEKLDAIQYEIMTLNKEGSKTVKAKGEEYVEENASGTITVFNNFDSKDQRLIKNTRFESSDGLIYRIRNSIVVPGIKQVNGKSVPGSVDVKVYADEPGEKYNIGLADFTIPGFKGDPRFNKFYARSKTNMVGGFVGNIKIVSDVDKETVVNQIHSEIEKEILAEIQSQIPKDFILFNDLIKITFEPLPNSNMDSDTVLIKEKTILSAVILSKIELAKFIAQAKIEKYTGEDVEVLNLDKLTISVVDKDIDISKKGDININIKGDAQIIWIYDEDMLKADLIGKNKGDFDVILSKYKGIDKAELVLRPFWKRVFPDNPENIKIERILK